MQIYELLYEYFGPQKWWPGDTPFEIIVGAVLTQNTNWANVEKAIANLKAANALSPEVLYRMPQEQIALLIKPAGYFNIKAKRLKNLLIWLFEEYDGCLKSFEQMNTSVLREELLSIKGIGPETADSILLYAFARPVFVVDTYTARIMARHELIEPPFDYQQLQQLFESNLCEDAQMYNEYHALIVRTGKEFCKPKSKCSECPLNILPHNTDIDS